MTTECSFDDLQLFISWLQLNEEHITNLNIVCEIFGEPCIHTYMHACMHTYTHTHTYKHVYVSGPDEISHYIT